MKEREERDVEGEQKYLVPSTKNVEERRKRRKREREGRRKREEKRERKEGGREKRKEEEGKSEEGEKNPQWPGNHTLESTWQPCESGRTHALVSLCLAVLQMSNDTNSDSEKLSQLQKIIHPQQNNLSEILNISWKDPTEESLQSQISALLERQKQMATKLCKEFLIHTSGNLTHICKKARSNLSP